MDAHLSVASSSTSAIQPGSGDEYLLVAVSHDTVANNGLKGTDGSNTTGALRHPVIGDLGSGTSLTGLAVDIKLGLTNGEYILVDNNGGSTCLYYWAAVETK